MQLVHQLCGQAQFRRHVCQHTIKFLSSQHKFSILIQTTTGTHVLSWIQWRMGICEVHALSQLRCIVNTRLHVELVGNLPGRISVADTWIEEDFCASESSLTSCFRGADDGDMSNWAGLPRSSVYTCVSGSEFSRNVVCINGSQCAASYTPDESFWVPDSFFGMCLQIKGEPIASVFGESPITFFPCGGHIRSCGEAKKGEITGGGFMHEFPEVCK